MGGETATYKCACCGKPFVARTADRARGWARFCSKSCKAIKQARRGPKGKPVTHRAQPGLAQLTENTAENREAADLMARRMFPHLFNDDQERRELERFIKTRTAQAKEDERLDLP